MGLSLTFLGRTADRWRVRVLCEDGFEPLGLTVALVSEAGSPLGPTVVVPRDSGRCMVAELRGPIPLPLGTVVVATADTQEGATFQVSLPVDTRRGLHAFLHADGRLPLETDPSGSALTRKEIGRLASRFPWLTPYCDAEVKKHRPANDAAAPPTPGDDLRAMLEEEFDIDPDDIPDELGDDLSNELLKAIRR